MTDIELFYKYLSEGFCVHKKNILDCDQCLKEMINFYYRSRL